MKKFVSTLKKIFGALILLCFFAGALSLAGYIVALFIGGETATNICTFVFSTYLPYVIKTTTVVVFIGLLIMYLEKQKSSAPEESEKSK